MRKPLTVLTAIVALTCASAVPAIAAPAGPASAARSGLAARTAVPPGGVLAGRGQAISRGRHAAKARPLPARVRRSAGTAVPPSRAAAAADPFNPVTGSQGFTLFIKGNAALNATASAGPVALGGNLSFGSGTFNLATQTAGTFTASGDSLPTGLLIGGSINWAGSGSSGTVSVQSSSYVKLGDLTGSTIAQSGSAATHIVPAGHTYSQLPQVAEVVNQPTASVSQSGLINFTSAFSTFQSNSADMASCANTVVLDQANGTPLTFPLAPGTNAYITLAPGTQNILNITSANLANISLLTFRNVPTATMPLIINVDTSGAGNSFSWTPPNIHAFQDSAAAYLLWNFSTATQVTLGGSETIPGTIYAPGATVTDVDTNGLNGGVIAAAYAQGTSGGSDGGQVLSAPFATTIGSCTAQQLTISATAGTATAAPGQTVHYTVTATNSGNVAYTGAAFTDALSGVLDDASYNGDASASSGSVSFSSPNLSWTGNLAVGATATITFSVTVSNPDTGNKVLSSTVTSTTTGSNCASGSTDSRCSVSLPVSVLTIAATASPATAAPGGTVSYTITVTNSGQAAYTVASLSDSLSGVLDDASYNGDAVASSGSVSFSSPNLNWTGSLAVGATATITFSVTVSNPDTGNKVLSSTVTSATAGSNCASGSTDARCATSVTVLVPGLTIALSADTGTATPGSTVHYTVTVTNSGQSAYASASFADSLSGLLDDASYNNNAFATSGSVSYSSPVLTWTGSLAVGASATITYSVTVKNPDTGEKLMVTAVTSATPGSNCASGSTDPQCSNTVTVLVPGLTIAASAGSPTTTPGSVVHYTVTVTNSGQTAYTGATFTDPLGDVLDDASYNNDATAVGGSVSFASQSLTWTGDLAVGASASVTFSVTVHNPDTGNTVLSSTVTSATPGSNCASGSGDARCTSVVDVAVLTIVAGASPASTVPGGVVRFTTTFTNAGQVPYTGITISTSIADVLDDATADGDQTATSGTISVTSTAVTWTGSIPVGGTVTISGSVTVKNPDPGNNLLVNHFTTAAAGSNCPVGGTDPRCGVRVPVLMPGLTISQAANVTFAVPGQHVTFTVTIADTGQTSYAGAVVTDSLAGVLDDAAYDGDASPSSGSVSYASPLLTWTGNLSPGDTVTITFSATVNNPDAGDKLLAVTVASANVGSSCPPASPNPGCAVSVPVLTPELDIVKTASTAAAVPGQKVNYTIKVTNAGQLPYTSVSVTDSLTGVLDDAAYDGDASATVGTVSYASPVLTWTGSLNPGDTAVITYSVTVNSPATGDGVLTNTVTSSAAGSECPAGSTDPDCTTTVTVVTATILTFTNTSDVSSTTAGSMVHYTIKVTNSGDSAYSGATFTDSLAGLTDDAAYGNNASASSGTVSFSGSDLTWTGDVPAGGTVTITFSVTVHNPDTGNMILAAAISSTSPDSNCLSGSTDPRCASTVTVSQLTITNSASVASTTPGAVIRFTATFTNSGQTPYDAITIASDITNVVDDATPNGDQTATSGTLVLTATGISWTGDIDVGQTVTVTGTVTVNNPDTGNKLLASTITTAAAGSNCPAGTTDPLCSISVPVLVPALTITKTANATAAVPGQTVSYTITIADTGQTSYTGATVTDRLELLGDAAYNNNASPTIGSVSYASPVLTWTGSLSPGDTAVITYSVTVNNPDTGGKVLINTVASTATGSTCPPASPNSGCTVTIPVLTPALTITAAASPATATPGGTVSYTITIHNTGQTAYAGATVTEDLTGVLDDASLNSGASATIGTVSFTSPDLTWTGNLNPGDTATVTFAVTVNSPDTGDKILASTVTSGVAGSNCASGSTDPRCSTMVDVSVLTIVNAASVSTTTPGSTVNYTITVTNAGATSYTAVTVTDPLGGVLDDAAFTEAAASTGSVSFVSPDLTWTGSLAPGGTATVTFSVTVNNPDTGDKTLTSTVTSAVAGSTCPAGSPGTACTATVTVLIPALTITKTADTATTTPGSVVGYTVTVTDTGPTSYTGATVTDPIGGILNDAAYNNNATATSGTVSYASPVLTWTGSLDPGDSAVISFTVTVRNPDTGDKHLVNTVTSADTGSTCPSGTTNPACTATVTVLVPALTITKTANVATATPGSVVRYTITVADTGQTAYTGATVTDSLAGVLADAAYNNNASATLGAVSYASPVLTWTGDLAIGDTATITYSVTVSNPDTGGRILANTATSAAPGSTCPASSPGPACTATVSIIAGALSVTVPDDANLGSAAPGGTISASLGTVQVTDNQGFGASWTATVSATGFTTGTATAPETIPASDVLYNISSLTTSGPATFSFTPATTLSASAQAVVSATSVDGNNSASWDPLIDLTVPASAIAGPYTATITHSVS
jgi:choice-of-anchor A domain-containing protein/uncharacterized repeat protein (TIGR01451 family)